MDLEGRQVANLGPAWGELGGSGLLWRINDQASTHSPSGNRGSSRPTQPRPPANPCPPLEYLLYPQVRNQPNPLVLLAVQWPAGQTQGPWPKQRFGRPPQGGVSAPRRVCVTHSHFWTKIVTPAHSSPHSHFWAKIVTPSSPPSTHRPPPSSHLPPTTHTWLIEVNRGCAKVSIGCLAVGLYVPASAVQNP